MSIVIGLYVKYQRRSLFGQFAVGFIWILRLLNVFSRTLMLMGCSLLLYFILWLHSFVIAQRLPRMYVGKKADTSTRNRNCNHWISHSRVSSDTFSVCCSYRLQLALRNWSKNQLNLNLGNSILCNQWGKLHEMSSNFFSRNFFFLCCQWRDLHENWNAKMETKIITLPDKFQVNED